MTFLDLGPLLLVPLTWGAITGLGLATWASKAPSVRRWGERLILAVVVVYLLVGVLAGEHLGRWARWLPATAVAGCLSAFEAAHRYSPFAVMQYGLPEDVSTGLPRVVGLRAGFPGRGGLGARAGGQPAATAFPRAPLPAGGR